MVFNANQARRLEGLEDRRLMAQLHAYVESDYEGRQHISEPAAWYGRDTANELKAEPTRLIPSPGNVVATDGSSTADIVINWSSVPGATFYQVYRSTTTDGIVPAISNTVTAEYLTQTGAIRVAVNDVVNWYIDSRTDGFTGTPVGDLPGPGLVTDSNRRVGETSVFNFSYNHDLGPVAATQLPPEDLTLFWNAEIGSATQSSPVPYLLRQVTGTSFTDVTADRNRVYFYWIKAGNASEISPSSTPDAGFRRVPTPTGVTASDGVATDRITVNWSAAAGATQYLVFRSSQNNTATAVQIAQVATNSYVDTAAPGGQQHYYWIKGVDTVSTSVFSLSDSGYRGLSAPGSVSASDASSTSHVAVSWSPVTDATQYLVFRSTQNNIGTATQVAQVNGTAYNDAGTNIGQRYYYWVRATNAVATSGLSPVDEGYRRTPPPSSLSASDGTSTTHVALQWASVPGTTQYLVYRNTQSNAATSTLIAQVATTNHNDTSAQADTVYYYWVKATNAVHTSDFSAADSGFRAPNPPGIPQNVRASDGTITNQVVVTWGAVTGAESYEVWRGQSTNAASASLLAGNIVGTTYTDNTATDGIYYYFVRSRNVAGVSLFSAGDVGFLHPSGPGIPQGVSASDGSVRDRVAVQWSASANSTSYEVWRSASSDFGGATMIANNIVGTEYSDTSALPGQTSYYWVRGRNVLGPGPFGVPDSGFPAGVTVLVDSGQLLGNYKTYDPLLGDLDGDGDLDLFQSNDAGQGNRVWFNNGAGFFTDSGQVLGNATSIYGDLGDIDGDGDLDAVIAAINNVIVWINDGTGRFADSGQRLNAAQVSLDVELGDLDLDGDLDAYISSAQTPTPRFDTVWLNNGSGIFSDSGARLGGSDSRSVALADLDGDGDLDAFVANRGGGGDRANRIWINDGRARFTDSGQRIGNFFTQTLAVGDLDGDGDLDLFEANVLGSPNRIYFNNGNGTFLDSGQELLTEQTTHVSLGDADGDGDLDAFATNVLYLNNGSGQFTLTQAFGISSGETSVFGDLDGDRDLDVFVGRYDQASQVLLNITAPPQVVSAVRNDGNERLDRLTSLTFTFTDDVASTVERSDLTLFNTRTNRNVDLALATVSPGPGRYQVRFDFTRVPIEHGLYFVALRGIGISNAFGLPLDGNGDGTGGDDYQTTLRVTRVGDIDADGSIDAADAAIMFGEWGSAGGMTDLNFDRIIDAADAGVLFGNWTG